MYRFNFIYDPHGSALISNKIKLKIRDKIIGL